MSPFLLLLLSISPLKATISYILFKKFNVFHCVNKPQFILLFPTDSQTFSLEEKLLQT